MQLVIHNDDQTQWEFVVDLVRSVFDRSEAEAEAFTATVAQHGEAACGNHPFAAIRARPGARARPAPPS
ncbi:ATP-dependent Clp protease adaptor ClpS [Mesorhizobium amorphae]|uniref:ATP-dependent Clp protease adaptor ClpS n=1 Tax=Mesorhizobium amorphae TaxID=71433 RepID=UPI003ECDABF0